MWRKSLRVASRGVALLVGVPLAFAALDFPAIEAMGRNLDTLRGGTVLKAQKIASIPRPPRVAQSAAANASAMPVITQKVRNEFLDTVTPQSVLSLEIAKEKFFRTHVPYGAIIYREAKKNGLAPELVAAIVQTESDFRVRLVSNKSAQGLMQIVPETARLLGVEDPFDPEQNIVAGTRYLRYLLKRFPDERTALAAYNAGETKVARMGIPPYQETQSYIRKVNARTAAYRKRVHTSYLAGARQQAATR